jgi:hypothetical protein
LINGPQGSFRNVNIPSFSLNTILNVRTNNLSAATTLTERPFLAFNPATGFFTGQYFDASLRRFLLFSGAAATGKMNRAGGSFVRFVRTGSVTFTPATGGSPSNESTSKVLIATIGAVTAERVTATDGTPMIRVAAGGQVSSGGWSGSELRISTGGIESGPGVLVVDFVASAPTGPATQAFENVATESVFPIPSGGVTSVRVQGAGNAVTTLIP